MEILLVRLLPLGRRGMVACVLLGVVTLGAFGAALAQRSQSEPAKLSLNSPRIVVLKAKRLLHLFDGERLVRTYPVDLGTDAIGKKRREGDGRTPEGSFRIVTKNQRSGFHRFLGIDYPGEAAVSHGLRNGLISRGEAVAIRASLDTERRPDWTTALGGGLGIHGRGRGEDWTAGCIAVADDSVVELFDVLRLGDSVEILP